MHLKGPAVNVYRVSNNGLTGWRPCVQEIQAFSDQGCSKKAVVTYLDESGHNCPNNPPECDGSAAFDGDTGTQWRPQCSPCEKKEAWVSFSTTEDAKCIIAYNLGKGEAGGKSWNNGIIVELQNPDGSWRILIESSHENSVVLGIKTNLFSTL